MEEEFGRPASLGEVFIKTHTKRDDTYVDRKAKKIVEAYEKNLQEKLSQVEAETSSIFDGALRVRELITDKYTAIFLQSTEKDFRSNIYGLGSLKDNIESTLTSNSNQPRASSAFLTLQEQLKEAERKINEQAAENARVVAEQNKLNQLSLVEKYLRQTDPAFLNFMASHLP